MILYLKDPKNSTQTILDTINSFRNVAEYKINLQKSVDFLYTTKNERIKKNIRKQLHLQQPQKNKNKTNI
jgi:hypothetical protein